MVEGRCPVSEKRFVQLRRLVSWTVLGVVATVILTPLLTWLSINMREGGNPLWWLPTAMLSLTVVGFVVVGCYRQFPTFRLWWRGIDWISVIAWTIKITLLVILVGLGVTALGWSGKLYVQDCWCWWAPSIIYLGALLGIYPGKRLVDYCKAKKVKQKLERSAKAKRREALTELAVAVLRVAASKPRTLVYKSGEAAELHARMVRVIDACACTTTERQLIMSVAAERFAQTSTPATAADEA
ncbi:MAG: hypothetical protein US42_C0018G0035 [Candidatus Magasanikbacteria bacterium GW2011_GWC2_37_14]|uniref:Uncharacterized protein n=1 Tax=Candidatus Magasanikbacteria bacterium GW2011_GWC2_37_14 TaxID=1619046 RepID=A0A0G0JFN1_9BACT|nr:MAG: hypothetical protein US42_C0018G0035 [Candidatus Magasanikbacteria bacterium GW2011_GWC2_37_14]